MAPPYYYHHPSRRAEEGFLVPARYKSELPNDTEMYVVCIIWGVSLACAIFTAGKAGSQTWRVHLRGRLRSPYIVMIWSEWLANVGMSLVCWFFLAGYIPVSFWVFFGILCFWVVQMQCILQIIINRVSLLISHPTRTRQLRFGVCAIISIINIFGFCIWIPARLQISDRYVRINHIWDHTEKVVFAIIDAGLNLYFIINVRRELIQGGLSKYTYLYRFNACMMCISVALDIILIGSMSISSGVVYIQFHPLVYTVKLHIELNMAELIAKIVKSTNVPNTISYTSQITDTLN